MGDQISIGGSIGGVGIAIGTGASVNIYGNIHYYPIQLRAPLRNLFKPLIEDCTQLFGGRGSAFAKVIDFIREPRGGYLVITAPAGFGKTTFIANLVSKTPEAFAYHFFAPLYGKDSLSEESFLRNVVEQIAQWHAHKEELPDTLDGLRALFQQLVDEPLEKTQVLILDGLDEVSQWKFTPYLSRKLPDYLHFIVTVRDVGQNWQAEFRFPPDQVTHLPLGGLDREGVTEVLRAAGERGVAFASDNSALDTLLDVAAYETESTLGADPFYVKLLAEDVATGDITTKNVEDQPKGLNAYLHKWLEAVVDLAKEAGESTQPVLDIVGTMIVALAPICRKDLEALHPSLRGELFSPFPKAIAQVGRFVTEDDMGGYALVHPRLRRYMATHPDVHSGDYLSELLAYCVNWQVHSSLYALQHYAQHLFAAERWSELFAIACDDNYSAEQDKAFPEDLDLPLRTIAWAIEAAMKLDNPVKMGELILRRAARAARTRTQETPLDALRAGLLDRAVSLAELYDFERRTLWLLLLSWELQGTGKKDAAREALRRLQSMKLQHLSGWSGACTAYLLLPVVELSSEVFADLGERLLWRQDAVEAETWHSIRQVSEILVHRGYYQSAVEPYLESWPNDVDRVFSEIARQKAILGDGEGARNTVDKIRTPAVGAQTMAWIATEKAKSGKINEAREALKSALDLAHNSGKEYAIAEVAVQQAQVGLLEEALHTCEQVTLSLLFINTLTRIAICWHERGGDPEPLLLRASQYVYEKLEPEYKTTGLSNVAVAYAQTSRTPMARQMLDALIDQAIKDQDAESLSDLTQAQADAGFFDAALQTLSHMEESGWKSNARGHIIERRAAAGQFDEALEMARSASGGLSSFVGIAGELTKSGQGVKARDVFAEILAVDSRLKDPWSDKDPRSGALYHIAVAEAQNGRFQDARSIAQHINSDSHYYTGALEQIAVEQVRLGELAAAKVTLEELRQVSRYACNQAGTQIVMSLADKDNLAEAREFTKYTERTDRSAEAAIIVAEARTGNVVGALAGARELGELASRAIGRIAEIALRSGRAGDFQKVDLTFRNQKIVVQTNAWMAYAYMRVRQVLTAEQMLHQALLDSRQIEETVDRQKAMVDIAVVQRCAGRIQDAEETLTRAVHVLRRSSEFVTPLTEGDLRKRMVDALVEAGERVAAFEQAVRIADLYKQARALSTIAGKPAPQGFPAAVLHITDMIQISRHSWIPYMAQALVKAGDKESFKRLLVPSADNTDSAYKMCGLLAKLYPDHIKELLRIVHSGQ